MALEDPTLDDEQLLTPPGWATFVQPAVDPMSAVEYQPPLAGVAGSVLPPAPPPPPPPPPAPAPDAPSGRKGGEPVKRIGLAGDPLDEVKQAAGFAQAPIQPADLGAATSQPMLVPTLGPEVDAISGGQSQHDALMAEVGPIGYDQPRTPTIAGDNPADPSYLQHQADVAGQELPSARDATLDNSVERRAAFLTSHPDELAKDDVGRDRARNSQMVAEALRLSAQDQARQKEIFDAQERARVAHQRDRDQLVADVKSYAADPNPHPGILRSIGNVIALTLGGAMSQYTGGRNLPLEQLNKSIDQYQQAQTHSFSVRSQGLAANEEADAERFRDQTAFRIGTYQRALGDLQTKMQDFDPRGTQASLLAHQYQQIAGAQQKAYMDFDQKGFENRLKIEGSYQKQQELDETKRYHDLEYDEKMAKLKGKGGAGAGGATNPNYTVASTFFDPFTNEPVFGKRALEDKGEKGERVVVGTQISNYGHVQQYWDELHKIGAEIGYAKSAGESVWSARKGTLEDRYDKAREALTVYLTKELGDKLTQGQLEAQAHRIPERARVFDATDPKKIIESAQEDADRDFATDMGTVGINAAPIIQHAREMRADRPEPSPDDAVSAAQQAVAAAPAGSKAHRDAQAALDEAKARETSQVSEERQGKAYVAHVNSLVPAAQLSLGSGTEAVPPEVESAIRSRNEAADTYNQELAKFRKLQGEHPDIKPGSKLKGDVDAARVRHQKALEAQAAAVVKAQSVLEREEARKDRTNGVLPPSMYAPIPADDAASAFRTPPAAAPAPAPSPLAPRPGVFAPRGPVGQ